MTGHRESVDATRPPAQEVPGGHDPAGHREAEQRVEVLEATLSGELDHRLAIDAHLSSVKAHNEREAMALDRERRLYDAQADTMARLSQAYRDLQQQHQAALAEAAMYRSMAMPQGREPGHDVGPPPVQG